MAQGPHLTQEVKRLITKIHLKHPEYGPTSLRRELLRQMKEVGLDLNFGPDWPGVSAVGKVLNEIRHKDEERTPESKKLDEDWSLGSLVEYPIPQESLPLVWEIFEKCLMEDYTGDWLLSIREALWVGRLHKIIEKHYPEHRRWQIEREELDYKGHPPAWLTTVEEITFEDIVLEWAYKYSTDERISEIDGEPFNSFEFLDGYLLANVYEFCGDRKSDFIEYLIEEYKIDEEGEDKLKSGHKLSISDIGQIATSYAIKQKGGKQ